MTHTTLNAQQSSFAQNQVIAHRGAWKAKSLPQNSIASLNEAIRLGCAGSEFDVRITADDVLVVNHDRDFLGIDIETNTYAQLCTKQLPNGEKISTLHKYLIEGMKQSTTKLILEIKSSSISKEASIKTAEKVVKMVKLLKADKWVMYISFDYDILLKIKSIDPQAQTAHVNGDKSPKQLYIDGIIGIDYHYNVYRKNPEWIQDAKNKNISLNAWTVNKSEDMDWLLNEEFNYITTDEPELLFERIKN